MSAIVNNGPRSLMYTQKPVLDLHIDVKLPTCMYNYPKVFKTKKDNYLCDLMGLQKRQETIIQQLQQLVHQIDNLRGQLQHSPNTEQQIPPQLTLKEGSVLDVVVSCNPERPCFSLLPLKQLLESRARLSTRQHMHSTVINKQTPTTFNKFTNNNNRENSNICLTLLWKQVDDVEFIVDPVNDRNLVGEVTLARYISNYLPDIGVTNDPITDTQMDNLIDTLTTNLMSSNSAGAVRHLNSQLTSSRWILGDRFSLVDICVWSALMNITEPAESNIRRWMHDFKQKFSL